MNRRGLRLDRPYAEEALSKFQAEFDANEAKLAAFGIEPTKTGNYSTSRAGLIAKFEALGVQFTEYTPAGAPKLDDEILTKIADRDDVASEIARTVLAAKAAQKSMGFIRGFLEAADPNDRVHPTINPLGTLTGRMSCSNPNLQNLTRDAKEIRGCFVAEPGHVLLSVDYSAVEWRVAAAVTNDANMKRVFAEGGDIHADVARIVFGPDFTKAHRQQCKSVGLGRLYGGGVDALARQSGLPRHKVEEAVAAIDSLYPGIKETVQRDYETIDGPTPVELLSGRRVIVDSAHKALNVRCQGFACDLLKYAILRLFDKGYGQYILLPVHDELIFSVPKDEAQEMLAEIQEIMRCEVNGVSIEADGEILGERWRKA
jgi:DNA polymerase-1